MLLGHYDQALILLEQVLQKDEGWVQIYRGRVRLDLGQMYDLLGQRDKAVQSYQQTLQEPDCWDEKGNSPHVQAQRYLQHPFTERDLLDKLKPRR
jgi:tetratricopeptide (TPR) repeat protein